MPGSEHPAAIPQRGMLFAHPCGCGTLYSGRDFCQHSNRYEHHDPPKTDAVTKMQRLEGWLRGRGVTPSG